MSTTITFTNTADNFYSRADEINRILDEHPDAVIQIGAGDTIRRHTAYNLGSHVTTYQNGTIGIRCAAKTKPGAMNLIFVKRGHSVTLTY